MGRGEGKGWAKGLSAATDPRVARAAAAHRGLIYERQTPAELCRWRLSSSTRLPLVWSDAMAYVVGLTATDGCLITGRRRIDFKSGDRQLVTPTSRHSAARIASGPRRQGRGSCS